jgi:mRNA interferase MazF
MKRGELRWCTLRLPDKRRPVLILTRTSALAVLTGITIAPVTLTIRTIPTYILLTPAKDGVPNPCAVNLDNVQTI